MIEKVTNKNYRPTNSEVQPIFAQKFNELLHAFNNLDLTAIGGETPINWDELDEQINVIVSGWDNVENNTTLNQLLAYMYAAIRSMSPVFVEGTEISFGQAQVYNTAESPGTGDITDTLDVEAIVPMLGLVQKIYHTGATVLTVPDHWQLIGDGVYVTDEINIIYAEWNGLTDVDERKVEYWIVQIP